MISKLVDCLNDQTAVSNRAAGSVAIRARESASTRAKGRFRQLKEVHGLEIVTFLAAAEQSWDFWEESSGLLLIRPFVALSST